MIKVKPLVRFILRNYPKARDNDELLYCIYLERYTNLKTQIGSKHFKIFKDAMTRDKPFESLSRMRRKIQANGEFVGNRRISRKDAEVEVHDNINKLT